MADNKYRKQRKPKRILLSSLLTLVTDGTILVVAFSPVQPATRAQCDRCTSSEVFSNAKYYHTCIQSRSRWQRNVLRMNDFMSDNTVVEDRKQEAKSAQDVSILRSKLGLWKTRQLLSALNERGIRYAPTSSRSDLVSILVEYWTKYCDNMIVDANDNGPENMSADIKPSQQAWSNEVAVFTNSEKNVLTLQPQVAVKERLYKRLQRRNRQPTRRDRLQERMSNVLYSVVPSVTGNVLDYTKRKARRLKRQIADFMLLDEETGIRDVLQLDYVRRDQVMSNAEVVLGPGDAIEVIVDDTPKQHLSSNADANASSIRRDASSSNHLYSSGDIRRSVSSPIVGKSQFSDTSTDFRLPPASQERAMSFSSTHSETSTERKRTSRITQEKKVYNPYNRNGRDFIYDDDKDAIDRVADFLATTADQIFDRFLVSDKTVNSNSNQDNVPASKEASNERYSDRVTTSSSSQRHRDSTDDRSSSSSSSDKQRRTRRKHWKDRLEERLDSMLGLHENGDFYRSWTERFEDENDGDRNNNEPFDAYSVAQGRKPPKRKVRALYDKPFWEEDGNIFSLLFGRTQHYTPPRWDLRMGFQTGSLLSIFRFVVQNILIVASYLCRWASTQGALPQPVVVFGVGSAMLCARPHRRMFTAGIALLILRTVGEVLHGYTHGSSGWEDDDYDETGTREKKKADIEQNDEDF